MVGNGVLLDLPTATLDSARFRSVIDGSWGSSMCGLQGVVGVHELYSQVIYEERI